MSLWTPDGERPVSRSGGDPSEAAPDRETAEAMASEMAEVRAKIAATPASVIVANHVMGFYELAAIHLGEQPPQFAEAQLAIDAMSAVLDHLQGRLGENEPTLREARSQLQMAFVELRTRQEQAAGGGQADAGEPG